MVSSRDFNELWVIDHSIPNDLTATAAGHLLYRWGNPEAYDRGDSSHQRLFYQHDIHWGNGLGVNPKDGSFSGLIMI